MATWGLKMTLFIIHYWYTADLIRITWGFNFTLDKFSLIQILFEYFVHFYLLFHISCVNCFIGQICFIFVQHFTIIDVWHVFCFTAFTFVLFFSPGKLYGISNILILIEIISCFYSIDSSLLIGCKYSDISKLVYFISFPFSPCLPLR